MLQLQRASAGSGKTFTLARKYIGYLISFRLQEESRPRLCRTPGEIMQSLRQILAITFTNMATTEMKERIVEKLSALGEATSSTPKGRIDYLDDFKKEFGATAEEIARTARMALGVVLNNFSDFNVSTIDAFFQSVLRTFAYETNLTDSYQVELDADLLASVGINKSLEEVNTTGQSPARYWIERLMDKGRESGSIWNVFARSENERALYQNFLRSAKRTENETYKQSRPDLEAYFKGLEESGLTFRDIYERLEYENERRVKEAHLRMKEAANRFLSVKADAPAEIQFSASPYKHAVKILDSKYYGNKKGQEKENLFAENNLEKKLDSRTFTMAQSKKTKKLMSAYGAAIERVEDAAAEMYTAWAEWCAEKETPRFLHWIAYRDTLLYLGLLHEIRQNVADYLRDNGLLELSDTGMILRQIIDKSEVPFIYERLGARLNHYLIDEFQDTSSLQWENISPLLTESVSRGEESLVIGDAKQSIYRFRNADSDIITTKLPKEFKGNHHACGDSVEENTNWRSDLRIVEFNNYFFHALSSHTKDDTGEVGGAANVYAGVVQRPSHTKDRGLVSVKFVRKTNDDAEDNNRKDPPPYFNDFGQLVQEMLGRGYRQRDITFLVNTRNEGAQIIDTFVEFNSRLPEGAERIEFVSEESLYVSSSKAVTTVIAALKAISEPRSVILNEEKERPRKGLGSWEKIGGHFHLYVMQNGGVPTPELLERFKASLGTPDDPTTHLQNIVTSMQAHTLPALVEMAIGEFVSKEEAMIEAPYLAALQDLVLDYSERNSTDIASFLKWWESVGSRKSITSPKDIDAVKVMTIHKSKGLQFKCVVVPGVDFGLTPGKFKTEWLWVTPDQSISETGETQIPLPPVVPVESTMLGSLNKQFPGSDVHTAIYSKYAYDYMMDILNKAYVAFTRAEEELHLYVPFSSTQVGSTQDFLIDSIENDSEEENSEEAGIEKTFERLNDALLTLTLKSDLYLKNMEADSAKRMYMPAEDAERTISIMELPEPDEEDEAKEAAKPKERSYRDTEIGRVEFGHPRTPEERAIDEAERLLKKAENEETGNKRVIVRRGPEVHVEGGYVSGNFPHSLHYRLPDTGILTDDEQEEAFTYIDPRDQGNIIHEVLEHMKTVDDLSAALRYIRVRGKVTASGMEELRGHLEKMLANPTAAGWFRPGLRVLAERPLIAAGKERTYLRRPDRIVIDEEGRAIVIDYKTGQESKKHHKQVKEYVEMLRNIKDGSGRPIFTEIEGWLWYLVNDKKERIC